MKFVAVAIVAVLVAPALAVRSSDNIRHRNEVAAVLKLSLWTRAGYCSTNDCRELPNNYPFYPWTIFALIPMQADGRPVTENCLSVKFKSANVESIATPLRVLWPSFTSSGFEAVWRHRFNHYGRCTVDRTNAIHSVLDYFKRSIQLYQRNNLVKLLRAAGITPSDSEPVSLSKINSAIAGNATAVEYYCAGERQGVHILQKINMCFDPHSMERISCRVLPSLSRSCGSENVWYLRNPQASLEPTAAADSVDESKDDTTFSAGPETTTGKAHSACSALEASRVLVATILARFILRRQNVI